MPILKDYLEMISMKFESVVQQYCIGYGCHASFSLRKKESHCWMQSCPLHWGVLKGTVVMLQCTIVLCII